MSVFRLSFVAFCAVIATASCGTDDPTTATTDTGADPDGGGQTDAEADAAADAQVDSGADAAADASVDASSDTGIDTGIDTGVDTGADTDIAPELSCAGRCAEAFDPEAACQCNTRCVEFGNCCDDVCGVCSADVMPFCDPTPVGCDGVTCSGIEVCDPATGVCLASDDDLDGDGRSNGQEITGYPIQVDNGTGPPLTQVVTSNPRLRDTEGDGLEDGEEFSARSNPREPDTDNDGVDDYAEVIHWLSEPFTADTDGDGLEDGEEVAGRTDPNYADTDGDGLEDSEERPLARDPSIAELPALIITVIEPLQVDLNVEYSDEITDGVAFSQSYEESTESSLSRTDAESDTATAEASVTVSASVETGVPPSATASAEVSATVGYEYSVSTEITSERAESRTENIAEDRERSATSARTLSGGSIGATISLRNPTPLAFNVEGFRFPVLRTEVNSRGIAETTTVATLQPEGPARVYSVAGGGTLPNIRLETVADLNTEEAMELLLELMYSSTLTIAPANYTVYREGTDTIYLDERARARTALLIVDYGEIRPATGPRRGDESVLRHRVAADFAREYGENVGITLADALELTGHTARFDARDDGSVVLAAVDDRGWVDSASEFGFWVLLADEETRFGTVVGLPDITAPCPACTPALQADQIRLFPGDTLRLVFVRDDDRDQLNDREEYRLGTSDQLFDTDGDGISDTDEIRGWDAYPDHAVVCDVVGGAGVFAARCDECTSCGSSPVDDLYVTCASNDAGACGPVPGWNVFYRDIQGVRFTSGRGRPDPTLADTDADGLSDLTERELGTNPAVVDSDYDGVSDGIEVLGWPATTSRCSTMLPGDGATIFTDPLDGDTDGDSIGDGAEANVFNCPLAQAIPAPGTTMRSPGPSLLRSNLQFDAPTGMNGDGTCGDVSPGELQNYNAYALTNTTGARARVTVVNRQGVTSDGITLNNDFDGVLSVFRGEHGVPIGLHPPESLATCVVANDDGTASLPWQRARISEVVFDMEVDETMIVVVSAFETGTTPNGLHSFEISTLSIP